MGALVDRTGQRYGRLVVLRRDDQAAPASYGRRVKWICRCDCGTEASKTGHELACGDTTSCGCIQRGLIGDRHRTHGLARTSTYRSWQAAKERCHNPNTAKFPEYGGRGIMVCERWRGSFEAFLADMGLRPAGMTLDRIDGAKGYEPDNCRWATPATQAINRSASRRINWNGRECSVREVAESVGVPRTSLNKALVRLGDLPAAISYAIAHAKR